MSVSLFGSAQAYLHWIGHATRVAALATTRRVQPRPNRREWLTLGLGFRIVAGHFLVPRTAQALPESVLAGLDALYVRERNELFWAPAPGPARSLELLRFDGPVALVGKGPSLDRLRRTDFDGCCAVLAINHALQRVASLGLKQAVYGVQIDTSAGRALEHRAATRVVALCAAHLYRADANKFVFALGEFAIERVCTAAYAIAIARRAGARSVRLLAFDALTQADHRYAASLGLAPPDTRNWGLQLEAMRAAAGPLAIDFVELAERS